MRVSVAAWLDLGSCVRGAVSPGQVCPGTPRHVVKSCMGCLCPAQRKVLCQWWQNGGRCSEHTMCHADQMYA